MDWTFWMGIAVIVVVVGLTAGAVALRRQADALRGSQLRQGDMIADLEDEKGKGLYQSGWVP